MPIIANLLSPKTSPDKEVSAAQGSFASILKSELDSHAGALSKTGTTPAVADPAKTVSADFNKALHTVADKAREKLMTASVAGKIGKS